MKKVFQNIFRFVGIQQIIDWSRHHSLPGLNGVPVYDVVKFTVFEMKRDSILIRAKSVAFSFLVSIFPCIIVIFTLIPFIPLPSFQTTLMNIISSIIPLEAYDLVQNTIKDIINHQNGGLLSISLLLAGFYSARGVLGLMNSFDKALPNFRKRTGLNKYGIALKITFMLFILLVASMLLILAGQNSIHYILRKLNYENASSFYLVSVLKWIIIIMLFYSGISTIYYYGPATHKRWKFFNAGSTIAAFLCLIISLLLSSFINHFGNYNRLYGSIGTLIVLMIWIFYNSLILLVGFELNASIDYNKLQRDSANDEIE